MGDKFILLATATDLSGNSIGKLFIDDLIAGASGVKFRPHQILGGLFVRMQRVESRSMRVFVSICNRVGALQTLALRIYKGRRLRNDVNNIKASAAAIGADAVWVTLSSIESILIAEELIDAGIDVKVTVWDAPEYLLSELHISRWLSAQVLESFGRILKSACAVSVVSYAMGRAYKTQYGVDSVVLKHGVARISGRRSRNQGSMLRIVFAGSLYAKEEWNHFVRALRSSNWVVNGKRVVIYFLGNFPIRGAIKDQRVKLLGQRSFNESIEIISRCDIAYLPYWFSPKYALVAQTSFPGKLSAYVASGTPVFHHAPNYTEVAEFINTYPFGVTCSSPNESVILKKLTYLEQYRLTNDCREAMESAMTSELSGEVMNDRFARFIGCANSSRPRER